MYNKVTAADIAVLQSIVGEADVLTGAAINPDYAHDELGGVQQMPEVLVRARSTEEISAIMKLAYSRNIPVTVRGSGTGLVQMSPRLYLVSPTNWWQGYSSPQGVTAIYSVPEPQPVMRL